MRLQAYLAPSAIALSDGFAASCAAGGGERDDQGDRDDEGDQVGGVGPAEPRVRHHHTRQRRARDPADRPAEGVEGGRGREMVMGHDPRPQRVERGALDRHQRRGEGGDHIQRPYGRVRRQRVEQQHRAQQPLPGLRPDDQAALVERVGERTAVQPENDQRYEFHRADGPHGRRRSGQVLDLHRQRDERQEAAEIRDQPRHPQPPEVGRGPPGSEVGEDGAEAGRGRVGVGVGHERSCSGGAAVPATHFPSATSGAAAVP